MRRHLVDDARDRVVDGLCACSRQVLAKSKHKESDPGRLLQAWLWFLLTVSGLVFTVSGLGSTVSGLGFTVSGLGSTVSGLGSTVSGLGLG